MIELTIHMNFGTEKINIMIYTSYCFSSITILMLVNLFKGHLNLKKYLSA